MKSNSSSHFSIASAAVLLSFALFALLVPRASDENTQSRNNKDKPAPAGNGVTSFAGPAIRTNEFFRTVTDPASGEYAIANSEMDTVIARDKNGKSLWSTNVAQAIKKFPRLARRKIGGMQIYKGELWVDLGRGYAVIDVKTGHLGVETN